MTPEQKIIEVECWYASTVAKIRAEFARRVFENPARKRYADEVERDWLRWCEKDRDAMLDAIEKDRSR